MTYLIQARRSGRFYDKDAQRWVQDPSDATHYDEPPLVLKRHEEVVTLQAARRALSTP